MCQSDNAVIDLMKICRDMMNYIKQDTTAKPEKDSLIAEAKGMLKRADAQLNCESKKINNYASPYFGQLGYRYDFKLKVNDVQKRESGYLLTCSDTQGRFYSIKAENDVVDFDIEPGLFLFFRGQITDRKIMKNRHVTFLQILSGLQKVSPSDSF